MRNVSFGYEIKDIKLVKSTEQGDEWLATKWQPYEVSIVTVPADHTVGIGRAMDAEEKEVNVIEDAPIEPIIEPVKEETPKITVTEKQKGDVMTPEQMKEVQEKARSEERQRSQEIHAVCTKHGMDADFTRGLVDGGKSIDEAREAVLAKISTRQKPVSGAAEQTVGLSQKEIRNFSFIKVIRALANPGDRKMQEDAAFEREVSEAGSKIRGKSSEGFYVPMDILRHSGRRDLTVGANNGIDGGLTVATELKSFIEMLRNKSILQQSWTSKDPKKEYTNKVMKILKNVR